MCAGPIDGKTSRANLGRHHRGTLATPISSRSHAELVQESVLSVSQLKNVSSVTWEFILQSAFSLVKGSNAQMVPFTFFLTLLVVRKAFPP